jgi:hypothetical protein
MIRVEIEEDTKKPGRYCVSIPSHRLSFKSRIPLLDACREIKRMGGDTSSICGLFRKGRSGPDLTCSVGVGAELTVSEGDRGGPKIVKYTPFDRSVFKQAAE